MAKDREGLLDPKQQDATPSDSKNEQNQDEGWKYSSEIDTKPTPDKINDSSRDVSWSASEFIAHEKNITWYVILAIVTIVVSAVVYLLTKDKISTGMIILVGVIFGVYAARKPRLLNYKLDNFGLTVQSKLFNYDSFKSFSIAENSVIPNIILMPLKRFMPSLSIYLDPTSEEEVIKLLSEHLAQDIHRQDIVERFMLHIRF